MRENDEILIQQALEGDLDAFGKLVERYKDAVFALALHRLKNFEDARDVAQEAFIKAFLNLSQLRNKSSFVGWLKKITLSVASHWIRDNSKKNEIFIADIPDYEDNPDYWGTAQEMPDESLERKEFQDGILSALNTLSEANRLTTMLFYVDGLSYEEIARFQDVPISSVKGRLYQSRKKLKEEMINMLERTLKENAPGKEFTRLVLSDLEIVNQQLGGEAKLIAKEERIGNVKHTAVINNNGKNEIIIGTDIGIVMAFSPTGEELWRRSFLNEIIELIIKDEAIFVGAKGLMALDGDGNDLWNYPDESVKAFAVADLADGDFEIVLLTEDKIEIFSNDGKVVSEFGHKAESNGCGCSGDIGKVAVGDVNGDGIYEIGITSKDALCLFRRNGELLWSKASKEYEDKFDNGIFWSASIMMTDINDDGKAELITGACSSLLVFDGNGQEIWRYLAYGLWRLNSIAVGDIDSDGKKEIAVSCTMGSEETIFAVFSNDGQFLWSTNTDGLANSLVITDINNDGKNEVISGGKAGRSGSDNVHVFDNNGNLIWKYHTGFEVFSLTCCDVDKDGKIEVIAGADDLHLISNDGERRWVYRSSIGFKVAVADIDGDGLDEIITGSSSVCAYKGTGKAIWSCDAGHVNDLAIGDLRGNGKLEIVVSCEGNTLYLLNNDGQIQWKNSVERDSGFGNIKLADLNSDGQKEIVCIGGEIYMFNLNGNELWQLGTIYVNVHGNFGSGSSCTAIGNFDGCQLLIAGYHPGLWFFDGDGEVVWRYVHILSEEEIKESKDQMIRDQEIWREYEILGPSYVETADLNADGNDEIIIMTEKGLRCLDSKNNPLWQVEPAKQIRGWTQHNRLIRCADINNDGVLEIISAMCGLEVYDRNGQEIWNVTPKAMVMDIDIGDVNGDGFPEVVVVSDCIEVFSHSGDKIFEYTADRKLDCIALGDVDGDGVDEIVTGGAGVYLIKVSEASKGKIKPKKSDAEIKVAINKYKPQERKCFLIEGHIFDGFTKKPIAGGNIKIRIYSNDEKNRIALEQVRNVTTDAEGYYCINDTSAKMLGKSKVSLRYNPSANGYTENDYAIDYTEKDTHVVRNFGLLPIKGTASLSGWVRNIVDKTPMEDVEVEIDSGKIVRLYWWDESNWWNSDRKIKLRTDRQGEYSLQISAKYYNMATWKFRNRINPKKEGYEVVTWIITEDGTKEESKETYNFAYPRQNFYMLDLIRGQFE